MKVYSVVEVDLGELYVVGVYSTLEKAKQAVEKHTNEYTATIHEHEVDVDWGKEIKF